MQEHTAISLSFWLLLNTIAAFTINPSSQRWKHSLHTTKFRSLWMGSGEYTVELSKPLGIVLEEYDEEGNGVLVKSLVDGGAAAESGTVVPGDVLLKIGTNDVSTVGFDDVMDLLASAPSDKPLSLTLGDGLGRMDIAPNLAKQLSPNEAIFADAVVRAAVREIRKNGSLGDLLKVEIVLGAAVRNDGRCLVRFFAILSTDGVTTYSCNISATGKRMEDETIDIIALSCAKDEGWGQTVDLIP